MGKFASFVIGAMLATALTAGIGYKFFVEPSTQLVGQLGSQLRDITDSNHQLAETAGRRQATIDKAREIVAGSGKEIQKLRAIIVTLQEYYNNH